MVGALRGNAHALQHQADLPADVLPLVLRGYVHIARMVKGLGGGVSVGIGLKKVELKFRADLHGDPLAFCLPHRIRQQSPAVHGVGPPIGIADIAKHPHHLAPAGPPGKIRQGFRDGEQEQVRLLHPAEAPHSGAIKGNALGERAFELLGHDGNIFLFSRSVAEDQANELHILLLHIGKYVFLCIQHGSPFPSKNGKKDAHRTRARAQVQQTSLSTRGHYTLAEGPCQ